MRSLVLVGHGSHVDSSSALSVYHVAERLRARQLFDEVTESFWKEEPSLRQVLRTTASTDVTVIPMFIAQGYFTETVIPRELGLGHQGPVPPEGITRVIGGKTLRYTLPYGVHPTMTELVLACAREALPEASAEDTALLLVGQGLTRDEASTWILQRNLEVLQGQGSFAEVHALSLDDAAQLSRWRDVVRAPRTVVVPFFATEGQHTRVTLPAILGPAGPELVISQPVGTHPALLELLLQMVTQAHSLLSLDGDADRTNIAAWQQVLDQARRGLRLGEALIRPEAELFEIRHALDEGLPGGELQTFATPEGLRDVTRTDAAGQHRPVRTLRTLRRGWRTVVSEEDLPLALHFLYPAVVEESYAHSCRNLRHTPWATTARRQTGLYAKVQKAAPGLVEATARDLCQHCLRTRLWAGEKLTYTFLDGVPGGIPCAEPCTLLIAEVRDRMSESSSPEEQQTNSLPGSP